MNGSNYDLVKDLITNISGQANIISIPRVYITLTGDMASAAFLNQCVYWSDKKGGNKYGKWKSAKNWEKELGLTENQVRRCAKICSPWVKTSLHMAMVKEGEDGMPICAPTTHYLVDFDVLVRDLQKVLELEKTEELKEKSFKEKAKKLRESSIRGIPQNDPAKTTERTSLDHDAITETTTETTTEIHKPIIIANAKKGEEKQEIGRLVKEYAPNVNLHGTAKEAKVFDNNSERALVFLKQQIEKGERGWELIKHVYNLVKGPFQLNEDIETFKALDRKLQREANEERRQKKEIEKSYA